MSFSKLYLSTTAAAYTPATFRGAWNDTAGAVSGALDPIAGSGTLTTVTRAETDLAAEWDVLLYRGVSGPLAAQTITGTINLRLGVWSSASAGDLCYHVHVYATQGDSDTPRGTLLTDYREAVAQEWSASATANSKALLSAQSLSSLAVSAGDRLVIEIGYAARNVVATSYTGSLRYGCSRGLPDLAGTAANSTAANGTISFSASIAELEPLPHRVTQLAIETISPQASPIWVTQLVVETLSEVPIPPEPEAITTTRTDRAVFPTTAVIGGSDLPTASVLRLGTLPARTPGDPFLSVDATGEVTAGPFDASELPPAAFIVEPLAARRAVPLPPPRGGISGILRYGFSTVATAPPANQTVRLNGAAPYTAVTALWADYDSSQSEDLYWTWTRIVVGTSILIQDKDTHAQWVELETTGLPIDKGTYAEIPVRLLGHGDALATQECLIGMTLPAPPPKGLTGTYVVTWFAMGGVPLGRLSLGFEDGSCVELQPMAVSGAGPAPEKEP